MILTKYDSGDHIKDEMSRACSTCWEEQNCTKGFGGDTCSMEFTLTTEA